MTKKTVEVKETFRDDEIFGYLGGKKKITPAIFEDMGVPKAKQYTYKIEPMSDEDCVAIEALNRKESLQMSLWFSTEDGQKFTEANAKLQALQAKEDTKPEDINKYFTDEDFADVMLIQKQRSKISTNTEKFEIVQKYISDLSKPHPLAQRGIITDEAWAVLPAKVKAEAYNRIYDISVLGLGEAINLQ